MATNVKIKLLTKNSAWHTTNATLVLGLGRVIFQSGTNPMISKVGDGTTQLQNLKWRETEIVLTGLVAGNNTAITATQTLLGAMADLQKQIDYINDNALFDL